ncbi:MAG: gamma-glutamyl-gamma-aminobutyrate hydrolase family protein [Actinobacteria bacterium]|nr:gamma-glutamyl-gamma-aminobutyrate hydrolase family protein [Actinomycetota bacterium]
MPRAVVLSHHDIAHELGHLGPWLDRRGFALERIYREEPRSLPDADLLIVMGSPTSVATGHCLAPAEDEIRLVKEWVESGRPYLGLCFGAQVLARALGGEVTRMEHTFRGYVDLSSNEAADAGVTGSWVVWHDDAITAPPGAEVLAALPHADLVFKVGNAWGLQPHIEVSPESLERMAIALGAPASAYDPLVMALAGDEEPSSARVDQFLDSAFGTIR